MTDSSGESNRLSFLGRIGEVFLKGGLAPVLIALSLVAGIFALVASAREEDPPIVVSMADVQFAAPGLPVEEIVPFAAPGAGPLLVKVRPPSSDARRFAGQFARVAIPAGERRSLRGPRVATEGVETQLSLLARAAGRPRVAAGAVDRLRKALGAALGSAMAAGPAVAIDVCRLDAPRLAKEAADAGITVGRTSHRLRNPANAPKAWMNPILTEFRAMATPSPESFRVVRLEAGRTGYAEPIYLQPVCLTCHGKNVAPGLLRQIRNHYPSDRAIDFDVGEFRGLFWVELEDGNP